MPPGPSSFLPSSRVLFQSLLQVLRTDKTPEPPLAQLQEPHLFCLWSQYSTSPPTVALAKGRIPAACLCPQGPFPGYTVSRKSLAFHPQCSPHWQAYTGSRGGSQIPLLTSQSLPGLILEPQISSPNAHPSLVPMVPPGLQSAAAN